MNSGRTCAYCDVGTDLTNEHVLPNNFHKSVGDSIDIVKTPGGDKAISNPQEIRDVCAGCNSGPLSQLDTYLAQLYDKYLWKIVRSGDRIRFGYDFDLLLRLLLKIVYNVARTRKWALQIFQDCKQYMIGKKKQCPAGFRIFLQLLIPTPVGKTELPVTPGAKEVTPLPWRTELYNLSGFPGLVFACSTSFMSYRFFVLREDMSIPAAVRRRSIARWLKENKGAKELTRTGQTMIYASSVTVIDAVKGSANFYDQLTKARKLKAEMDSLP